MSSATNPSNASCTKPRNQQDPTFVNEATVVHGMRKRHALHNICAVFRIAGK